MKMLYTTKFKESCVQKYIQNKQKLEESSGGNFKVPDQRKKLRYCSSNIQVKHNMRTNNAISFVKK